MNEAGFRRPQFMGALHYLSPRTTYGITVIVFDVAAGVCTFRLKHSENWRPAYCGSGDLKKMVRSAGRVRISKPCLWPHHQS